MYNFIEYLAHSFDRTAGQIETGLIAGLLLFTAWLIHKRNERRHSKRTQTN